MAEVASDVVGLDWRLGVVRHHRMRVVVREAPFRPPLLLYALLFSAGFTKPTLREVRLLLEMQEAALGVDVQGNRKRPCIRTA